MTNDYQIKEDINLIDEKIAHLKTDNGVSTSMAIAELLQAKAALISATMVTITSGMIEKYQHMIENAIDEELVKPDEPEKVLN